MMIMVVIVMIVVIMIVEMLWARFDIYLWDILLTNFSMAFSLQPNTLYSFRVASVNDIGMSDFSAASQDVRTQPDSKLL